MGADVLLRPKIEQYVLSNRTERHDLEQLT